jgi:hypothetical protein
MNDLVKFVDSIPLISTFDLYSVMGYKEHRALKQVIIDNMGDFEDIGVVRFQMAKPSSKGGRPTKGYNLNEDQFILLILLARNTKEVVKLKVRVAAEFRRLRDLVAKLASQRKDPEWQNVRSDGKIAYKQKTDIIKRFVDYATNQGSSSAKKYYMALAKMENASLFFIEQKYRNLREIMTIKQLMQVCIADDVIDKALTDGMERKLHYKDIYKLAKERVCIFADAIGKSQVHSLELENKL